MCSDGHRHFLLEDEEGGENGEVRGVDGGSGSDMMSDGKRLILSTARHEARIERWLNIDAGQRRTG